MWGAFHDWLGAWEGWAVEPEHYRVLDRGRSFAIVTTSGRGRSSGLGGGQFTRPGANLFHVRDGKVTKLVIYWDVDRAFADSRPHAGGLAVLSLGTEHKRMERVEAHPSPATRPKETAVAVTFLLPGKASHRAFR